MNFRIIVKFPPPKKKKRKNLIVSNCDFIWNCCLRLIRLVRGNCPFCSLQFFHLRIWHVSTFIQASPFIALQIKISLHFWKKVYLVIDYYSFDKLLDVMWQWFIQDFYTYIYRWDWSIVFIVGFAKQMGKGSRFPQALA